MTKFGLADKSRNGLDIIFASPLYETSYEMYELKWAT